MVSNITEVISIIGKNAVSLFPTTNKSSLREVKLLGGKVQDDLIAGVVQTEDADTTQHLLKNLTLALKEIENKFIKYSLRSTAKEESILELRFSEGAERLIAAIRGHLVSFKDINLSEYHQEPLLYQYSYINNFSEEPTLTASQKDVLALLRSVPVLAPTADEIEKVIDNRFLSKNKLEECSSMEKTDILNGIKVAVRIGGFYESKSDRYQ